jgi:hypothetical protein
LFRVFSTEWIRGEGARCKGKDKKNMDNTAKKTRKRMNGEGRKGVKEDGNKGRKRGRKEIKQKGGIGRNAIEGGE